MLNIVSKDNSKYKALTALIKKPDRTSSQLVVEGVHAAQMLMASDWTIESVWASASGLHDAEVADLLSQLGRRQRPIDFFQLSDPLFRMASGLEQGVSLFVVASKPEVSTLDLYSTATKKGQWLLCNGIQDPGNLGNILRSAAAVGCIAVFCDVGCVNPFSSKVLRAGVGAHFSVPIIDSADLAQVIKQLQQHDIQVLCSSLAASSGLYDGGLPMRSAWILGNEGQGVMADIECLADQNIKIPMKNTESLNVASAASVMIFEHFRQHMG